MLHLSAGSLLLLLAAGLPGCEAHAQNDPMTPAMDTREFTVEFLPVHQLRKQVFVDREVVGSRPARLESRLDLVAPPGSVVAQLELSVVAADIGILEGTEIRLVSPSGRTVRLYDRVGRPFPVGLRGAWRASEHGGLGRLLGTPQSGTWVLRVEDIETDPTRARLLQWGLAVGYAGGDATAEPVRVFAGGSVPVQARLVGVETEQRVPALVGDEQVSVQVSVRKDDDVGADAAPGLTVSPSRAVFTAGGLTAVLTVSAQLDAVRESSVVAVVAQSSVVTVPRAVQLQARDLALELLPAAVFSERERPGIRIPDWTPADRIVPVIGDFVVPQGGVIEELAVHISVTHPRVADLDVLLTPPGSKQVQINISTSGGSLDILDENLVPAEDLTQLRDTYRASAGHGFLGAFLGARQVPGVWTLLLQDTLGEAAGGGVGEGVLHEWGLEIVFADPDPSAPVRVFAGGSAQVRARLVGVETSFGVAALVAGEALSAGFVYDTGEGVTPEPSPAVFSATTPTRLLTLSAESDATDGELHAQPGPLAAADIVTTPRAVEIAARQFVLELLPVVGFSGKATPNEVIPDNTGTQSVHSSIALPQGGIVFRLFVNVGIRHSRGDDLRVELVAPSGQRVELDLRGISHVNYDARGHTGLGRLLGTFQPAGAWTLTVGDYNFGNGGSLVLWLLSGVLGHPDVDASTPVSVLAGGSTQVLARLRGVETEPGKVPVLAAHERLSVAFGYETGMGVSLAPSDAVFSAISPMHLLTLDADFDASDGELRARPGSLAGADIVTMPRAVQVVYPALELGFESRAGEALDVVRVVAGASTEVFLVVQGPGFARSEQSLRVRLVNMDDEMDVGEELRLSSTRPRARLEIAVPFDAELFGLGIGDFSRFLRGSEIGGEVFLATTRVEIVPRQFRLSLLPERLFIPPGTENSKRALLSLVAVNGHSGLDRSESVTFSVTGPSAANVASLLSRSRDSFSGSDSSPIPFTVAGLGSESAEDEVTSWRIFVEESHGLVNARFTEALLQVKIASGVGVRIKTLLEGPLR